jgi:two-component system, NarL family, nitrate/nitrite sensor histidine kinase NarX
MKPKIHLVGGCASSLVQGMVSRLAPETGNDASEIAVAKSSMAATLLEEFLQTILVAMNASAGVVRVLSPDGLELRSIACAGLDEEVCQSNRVVDAGCGVCGKSSQTMDLETSDIDFCKGRYGDSFFGEACQFLIAVPLAKKNSVDEPAGVLTLFFERQTEITDVNKRILKSYAELIRVALKNVWRNEDAHQLSLLAERQSIANEIHDSLAQTLYFAKMRASLMLDAMKTNNDLLAYKCAQDIDEALEGSQKTVRELVTHFRCQMDPKGLKFALEKLVKDFKVRTNIALEYSNQVENLVLPLEYELQVFLIVRESLVNIATHSGANAAGLSVVCRNNQYCFTVEDNGGGVENAAPNDGHYGLEIMRERALRIGGVVEVEGLQGQGTRVQLIFSAPEAGFGEEVQ